MCKLYRLASGVDKRIERLREQYKNRSCLWCDKPKKDCDDECECILCVFPDKVYSWKEYPNINEWIRRNSKFYIELFKKGLAREEELDKNWRRTQLPVLQSTGTRIKDWTAFDLETNGERKLIPNSPEGFTILRPYPKCFPSRKLRSDYRFNCDLCGQSCNTKYFIKHLKKKQCIGIGGYCGYAFHFSDKVAEDIKLNMQDVIREMFHKNRKLIQQRIEARLQTHPEEKWLVDKPKKLLNYDTGRIYITPERLAELLLKLDKHGIKVFDDDIDKTDEKRSISTNFPESEKFDRKNVNSRNVDDSSTSQPDHEYGSHIQQEKILLILTIMKKLSTIFEYSVNKSQLLIEIQKSGMSETELDVYLEYMLVHNIIIPFPPESYKISREGPFGYMI